MGTVFLTVFSAELGDRLSHWINPKILEGVAAAGFIAIGLFMLVGVMGGLKIANYLRGIPLENSPRRAQRTR